MRMDQLLPNFIGYRMCLFLFSQITKIMIRPTFTVKKKTNDFARVIENCWGSENVKLSPEKNDLLPFQW